MFWLSLSLLSADAGAGASPAPTAPLRFDADTTNGARVTYPDDARGKPLVLVVGFTQASGKATAQWSESLQADIGTRASVVGVAVLDAVPNFARRFVERAIDKRIGPPKPGDPGFVMTFEGTSLRRLAPDGDKDVPVLYVLRADGMVALVRREPYSPNAASDIEKAVP